MLGAGCPSKKTLLGRNVAVNTARAAYRVVVGVGPRPYSHSIRRRSAVTDPVVAESSGSRTPARRRLPGRVLSSASRTEARAIHVAGGAGVIGFVTAVVAFRGRVVPLYDETLSVALVALIVCLVAAAVGYLWSYLAQRDGKRLWQFREQTIRRRVLTLLGLTLTHLAITMFAVLGAFAVLALSFRGLELALPHSALLVAVAAVLAGYACTLSGVETSTEHLAGLLTMLMVGGVFTAMLTSNEPQWWTYHFSYLGGGGTSGLTFNATLVVGGVVIITLADRLTDDLRTSPVISGARTRLVRTLMMIAGIACALTGIFPWDWYEPIHMVFGFLMFLSLCTLMLITPWAIPQLPHSYRIASLVILAVPLVGWLLVLVGTVSWTGAELISALAAFVWLVLFIRTVSALVTPDETPGRPPLEPPREA